LYFLVKTQAERVYGFEPQERLRGEVDANLSLNGLGKSDRVVYSDRFVGSVDTDEQVRLDSVIRIENGPCLLKVDAEGAEGEILRGAEQLNKRPDVRWLIETHSMALEQTCVKTLRDSGFETAVIPNAWWRVIFPEQRLIAHNRWLVAWKGSL
jgi:hypothetical protein